MILYCVSCNTNHRFTAGEVERIVYALQGEVGDRAIGAYQDNPEHWEDAVYCLVEVLNMSSDIEAYGELTEASVACRRRIGAT